jgi:transcriptional regulator with XRE-family HTH domain
VLFLAQRKKGFMKISKEAKQLAKDLNLNQIEAYLIDIKSKLYLKCAKLIKNSEFTHEQMAKIMGTSRARITRLSNMGEASVSLELLIKICAVLENKKPINFVA